MMSFSKHAKGFPSSSDGHHFVRNMHEFRRENRFFVMFWDTCPIGLLTGMSDSSQATMDSPVTIGRGIIWTLNTCIFLLHFQWLITHIWLMNQNIFSRFTNIYCDTHWILLINWVQVISYRIMSLGQHPISNRAHSRFASSQWETVLRFNNVSHWLGASLESVLWSYVMAA